MKKIITTSIILSLLLVVFVSAIVTQTNFFFEGVIQEDTEIESDLELNDVSVIGFICSNSDCSEVEGELFENQPLNSGTDNSITLEYPTELLSDFGYGVYFYKEGYIPFEAKATWNGNGDAGDVDRFLFKKAFCSSEIENFEADGTFNAGDTISITADIEAAINEAGPLEFVPEEISEHYTNFVTLDIKVTKVDDGDIILQETRDLELDFSSSEKVGSEFIPVQSGNYEITLTTSNSEDNKCINSDDISETKTIVINGLPSPEPGPEPEPDTTAPLISIIKPLPITHTTSTILVIVTTNEASEVSYSLDGSERIAILSNNAENTSFITSLQNVAEGPHTLTIFATDEAGNEASASVNFSVDILGDSTPGGDSDDDDEDEEDEDDEIERNTLPRERREIFSPFDTDQQITPTQIASYLLELDKPLELKAEKQKTSNQLAFLTWTFLILIIALLILIIIVSATKKK